MAEIDEKGRMVELLADVGYPIIDARMLRAKFSGGSLDGKALMKLCYAPPKTITHLIEVYERPDEVVMGHDKDGAFWNVTYTLKRVL